MEGRELPVGWARTTLSELISQDGVFSDGDWVESKDQDPTGNIRLLQLADIGEAKFLDKSSRFVNQEKFTELRCTEVLENDVLIARMPDPLGRACLVPQLQQKAITVVDVAIVRPGVNSVDPKWLMHAINSPQVRETIAIQSTGSTRRRIARGKLADLQFPLPPGNEQKRIAAKLDTTLAAVEACRQRLDGVAAILKRFRQAVLAAATSGELTREWREERGIDAGWEEGLLAELMQGKPRNGYSPKPADRVTAVKSLTLSATTTGRFLPRHFKYIDESIAADSHLWLEPGDILIQRANTLEYVGVSALYEGPPGEFIYPDLMMKCRSNQNVAPQFLHYLLSSDRTRNHFRSNATGTSGNMPKINQQVVMTVPVSWPSLEEQSEIVRRAQKLFSLADQLESRLTAARRIVERLTPALLAKAFRGELVHQDPGDEPASVLLERIRAARQAEAAAASPSRRGRRKAAAHPEQGPPPAAPGPPDLLAQLLQECGALSERALLAASELDPAGFRAQLALEQALGAIRETAQNGQVLLEAVG